MSGELSEQPGEGLAGPPGDDAGRPVDGAQGPMRSARLRRSPRYGVFTLSGAVLGALAAVLLVLATGPGSGAVLGYLLVALTAFGALLGAGAAVLAGLVVDRRDRSADPPRAPREAG